MALKRVPEAFNESQKYLECDPLNLASSNHLTWHYLYARQYDQALAQNRKTQEMDPNFLGMLLYLGWIYEQKGMYPEAIAAFQKAVNLSPTPIMLGSLGHAYGLSGRKAEAEKTLADFDNLSKQRYVSAYDKAIVYVGLKQREQALTWLERAAQERAQFMIYLDTDPRLDDLRGEQRFRNLVRQMGFSAQ
jgi:tetratricopeptide (TPR) repeat protein